MIHTLAEFKRRLTLGTQIRQIWNSQNGKVDHVFTITKVQTHAVATTCPDLSGTYWMGFPDRASIIFTENGWIRMKGDQKMAEYTWMPSNPLPTL